jgi:predicted ArsR family transcriptional regulator
MDREQRGHALYSDVEVAIRLRNGKSLTLAELAAATKRRAEVVRQALIRLQRGQLARVGGVRVNRAKSMSRPPIVYRLTPKGERAAEKWRARALEDLA